MMIKIMITNDDKHDALVNDRPSPPAVDSQWLRSSYITTNNTQTHLLLFSARHAIFFISLWRWKITLRPSFSYHLAASHCVLLSHITRNGIQTLLHLLLFSAQRTISLLSSCSRKLVRHSLLGWKNTSKHSSHCYRLAFTISENFLNSPLKSSQRLAPL